MLGSVAKTQVRNINTRGGGAVFACSDSQPSEPDEFGAPFLLVSGLGFHYLDFNKQVDPSLQELALDSSSSCRLKSSTWEVRDVFTRRT